MSLVQELDHGTKFVASETMVTLMVDGHSVQVRREKVEKGRVKHGE